MTATEPTRDALFARLAYLERARQVASRAAAQVPRRGSADPGTGELERVLAELAAVRAALVRTAPGRRPAAELEH
jgi:hypothetical protein